MRKYCKQLTLDNYDDDDDDLEDLIQIPVVHGIGDFVTRADAECRDEIDICIEDKELAVYVWLDGDCEMVASLPIEYCPVCGQKLSDLISQK